MWYAGEGKQGQNGTAFMVSKDLGGKVVEFRKVSGRIPYVRLRNDVANKGIYTNRRRTRGFLRKTS